MTENNPKLGPMNCKGEMWSAKVSGRTFYLGSETFVLTAGGGVWLEQEDEMVPASPTQTEKVLALRDEDVAIYQNRLDYVRQASEGNKALEAVLLQSACFLDGEPALESIKEHPGLKIAQVGRNASHYFYLGASEDGRLFKLSMDVWGYSEGEDDALFCRELTPEQPAGYMGHA